MAICEYGGEKEIEKYIDKGYEKCDQQQGELEELGLVNYGDPSYYFSHPDEYDKDKRIAELEEQLKELPKQIVEKIKEALYDITIYSGNITCDDMTSIFEHILKEYQGDGE